MSMDTATVDANGYRPNREQRRGYARKVRKLRLHFESTSLEGLVVVMRGVPVDTIMDIAALAPTGGVEFTPSGIQDVGRLFDILAEHLISWNLEDCICAVHDEPDCDDCGPDVPRTVVPVPADRAGVGGLDISDAMMLIQHWVQSAAGIVGGPAGPLDERSPDGKPSLVASLPMEPLSPSPSSSPVPS